MNVPHTNAAFTLFLVTSEIPYVVRTRPGAKPSMQYLSVGSHVYPQAYSGQHLAMLPLPSASRYHRHYAQCRYAYRGLSPHQFMPMLGVHQRVNGTHRFAVQYGDKLWINLSFSYSTTRIRIN